MSDYETHPSRVELQELACRVLRVVRPEPAGYEWKVYFAGSDADSLTPEAVRVTEVSLVRNNVGGSFLHTDPEGLAVCAALERAVYDAALGGDSFWLNYLGDILGGRK